MAGENHSEGLLARLIVAWQSAYPRQASGGPNALTGFAFQFDLTIREALAGWAELSPAQRERAPVFAEILSDAVTTSADRPVVVHQMKLTQSPEAIRKGLDDLFSVYGVAREIEPERLDEFEFGLAFRSGDTEAAKSTVKEWVAADPADRAGFGDAVRVGVHPDPGAEVVDLLANRFNIDAPGRVHRRWVGDLIAAAGYPVPAERLAEIKAVSRAIQRDLTDLARSAQGGIYFLTTADRPPERPDRGEVLTGQQPTVPNLRDGYFANRPEVTERLLARFKEWTESPAAGPAVKVFWIGGRSGSGKSIALLQLLSRLRVDGWDPIVWLGDKLRLLPDAARWARDSGSERPAVIAVDDPYAPTLSRGEIWDSFLAELNDAVQAGRRPVLPLLVCCGPTEQADMLQRDFPDGLEIEIVPLEREQPAELQRLRAWYEERTGEVAPSEPDENLLLVQLFFEWRTGGTLRQFAQRFRQRIKAAEGGDAVLQLLAEVLALNRIYVGFPPAAAASRLSDEQADLLDRFQREEHIKVANAGQRAGMWLAHPHLANGIYEEWFSVETKRFERQGHFRQASLESFRHGRGSAQRLAPIRAVVLGLTTRVTAIRDRIDAGVVDGLPAVYQETLATQEGRPPIDELSLWIRARIATGLDFEPDPVDEAFPSLTPQACGLPETARLCETLLANVDSLSPRQQADLIEVIADLLKKVPDWVAWARVAGAAIKARPSLRLRRLVSEWVRQNGHRDDAGEALAASVDSTNDPVPEVRAQALQLLRDQPGNRTWGRTWLSLWRHRRNESVRRIGLERLESSFEEPFWPYIWLRLADDLPARGGDGDQGRALEEQLSLLALRWLRKYQSRPGWGQVWGRIWNWTSTEVLEDLGMDWLEEVDPAINEFSWVWSGLWKRNPDNRGLRDLGVRMLNRVDVDNPAWSYVFLPLYETDPNPEVRAIGLRWARTASPNGTAWGYVLPALWRTAFAERDAELIRELEQAAFNFLEKASPEHGGWSYVFARVRGTDAVAGIRRRGQRWLADLPRDDVNWTWRWRRLLNPTVLSREDEQEIEGELLDMGEDWLINGPLDACGWSHVFLALWPRRPSDELRTVAKRWLRAHPRDRGGWDMVWRVLWLGSNRYGDGFELRRRGALWLRLEQGHRMWPSMWRALMDTAADDELRGLGERWVDGSGREHEQRRLVSERLAMAADVSSSELWSSRTDELAKKLARHTQDVHLCEAVELLLGGWFEAVAIPSLVWKELWAGAWRRVHTPALRSVGQAWLEQPLAPGPNGRSDVWKSLWQDEPSEPLYLVGCAYLEGAPHDRSLWSPIWFELWAFRPSEELARIGRGWIPSRPPGDRAAAAIEARIEAASVLQ